MYNINLNNQSFVQFTGQYDFGENPAGHMTKWIVSLLYFPKIQQVIYHKLLIAVFNFPNTNNYEEYVRFDSAPKLGHYTFKKVDNVSGGGSQNTTDLTVMINYINFNGIIIPWKTAYSAQQAMLQDIYEYFVGPTYYDPKPISGNAVVGADSYQYYGDSYRRIHMYVRQKSKENNFMLNEGIPSVNAESTINEGEYQDPLLGEVDLTEFAPTAGFKAYPYNNVYINVPSNTNIDTRLTDLITQRRQDNAIFILKVITPSLNKLMGTEFNQHSLGNLENWWLIYPSQGKTQYKEFLPVTSTDLENAKNIVMGSQQSISSQLLTLGDRTVKIYPSELSEIEMQYVHGFITDLQFISKINERHVSGSSPYAVVDTYQGDQSKPSSLAEDTSDKEKKRVLQEMWEELLKSWGWKK